MITIIDGFIVQLPLPSHIDEQKILMAVDPNKDVDGFHPTNVGKMALNLPTFISATPLWNFRTIRKIRSRNFWETRCGFRKKSYCGKPDEYFIVSEKKNRKCNRYHVP